jgi:hypothetical protein
MQGVTIKLYAADGTTVLATATTDVNGNYYFSSASGTSTASKIVGLSLQPETTYFIKITSLGSHASVANINLTSVTIGGTAGQNSGTSLANNDATLVSGLPTIQLLTGSQGSNNHTYDFGFVSCVLNVTASSTGPYCAGATIALSASGASGSATYAWTGPNSFSSSLQNPTINSANDLKSGTYQVIVNDGGCKDTATVLVAVNTVTATAGGTDVCLGSAISLTSSGTGATAYAWSGPSGYSSTLQNPNITPAVAGNAGTYTVTVTGTGGCTATASVVINVKTAVATASAVSTSVCVGGTISLSSTGGGTYSWSGPNSFISALQNPTISNASSSDAGTYVVTVTNVNGCTATASVSITINIPSATAAANSPVCKGSTISLSSSGGVSYSWSGPNGYTSSSQNPTLTNATTAMAGTYTVTTTNAGGCTATATAVVSVQTVVAEASGNNTCLGGTISLSATGGTSYSWSGPNSFTSSLQNPVISGATALNGGTYTVTVTNNGCTATATAAVTVSSAPSATALGGTVCAGEALQLSASAGAISYSWSGPNSYTSSQQNPVISPAVAIHTGTYTVTMTGSGGCAGTATVSVTVNALPTATASVASTVCEGSTLSLTSSGGSTYAWSGPNGFVSSVQNPTIPNASDLNTGTYIVTVTSAAGCTATASTSTTIVRATATAATSTPSICTGATIQLSATGGGTYSWSGPNAFVSSSATPSIAGATAAASGIYTVTVTAANSCTATATTTVSVNQLNATANSNSPVCVGQSLSLSASAGASYAWSGPNGFTSTLQNPVISYPLAANGGNYSVTVTDANGCTGTASTADSR